MEVQGYLEERHEDFKNIRNYVALLRCAWYETYTKQHQINQQQYITTQVAHDVLCEDCERLSRWESDKASQKCTVERKQSVCEQCGAMQC